MSEKRFYLDNRVGCVAVRDKTVTEEYPSPGLHIDTIGVVAYWHGIFDGIKHEWIVNQDSVSMAKKLCDLLNELEQQKGGAE